MKVRIGQSSNLLLRRIVQAVIAFALIYFGLSPQVAWPLYNALLFQPGHNMGADAPWMKLEKEFDVTRKEVWFAAADGTRINGWFFKLPGKKRVFLVSQGKGGTLKNRSGVVRMLLRCGGSVLVYNYRGYGLSKGEPTLAGVCQDAEAAYDYLKNEEGFSPDEIIAYGESFGSGVTGQLVHTRKVGGVIIQSGFSSLVRASRDVLPWLRLYPDFCFNSRDLNNVAVFSKPHPPLLIIHGRKDNLVSCQNAIDLYQSSIEQKTLLLLPYGDHGSFGKGNDYFIAVENFLNRNNL